MEVGQGPNWGCSANVIIILLLVKQHKMYKGTSSLNFWLPLDPFSLNILTFLCL
jgi:hypothetical protein